MTKFVLLFLSIPVLITACSQEQQNTIGFVISATCQKDVHKMFSHDIPKLTVKYHPINNEQGGYHSPFLEYAQLSSQYYSTDELVAYMNGALNKCGLDKKITFKLNSFSGSEFRNFLKLRAEQENTTNKALPMELKDGKITIFLNSHQTQSK